MDENVQMIPYAVHEGGMARMERTNRRLWILCLVMFLALVATNAGWIVYENQWEDVTTTTQEVQQDVDTGDGDGDVFVHGIGDFYGADKAERKEDYYEDPEEENRGE